jgi:hydroxymethylpyrimidine/phosphomethylpyrimidine kinase
MSTNPLVVSVHALDTAGGEGLVADAAAFAELDCRAACVATSVVVPEPLPLDVVARQLAATQALGPIAAVRVGFVGGAAQVGLVAAFVRRVAPAPTVLAISLRSGTTAPLDAETYEAVRRDLFPAARVVVVRAAEAASDAGGRVLDLDGLREAAKRLKAQGAKAVVIAGLLVRGRVLDFVDDDGDVVLLDTTRIQVPRVPGLASAYAAALAAHLARGFALSHAAEAAQRSIGFRLLRGR